MINTSSKELFQEAYELHQLGKLTAAAKALQQYTQ